MARNRGNSAGLCPFICLIAFVFSITNCISAENRPPQEVSSIRTQTSIEALDPEQGARVIPYADFTEPKWQYYRKLLRKIVRIQSLSKERFATGEIVQVQQILLEAFHNESQRHLATANEYPPKLLTCLVCRSTLALEKWCLIDGCQVGGSIFFNAPARFSVYRRRLSDFIQEADRSMCETAVDCE